ncbi:MAG: hypothetical protein ACPL7K_03150, partial [Armatimonadota bacterium]
FLGNLLVLTCSVLLLARLLKRLGAPPPAVLLSCTLFLGSLPVVESFYTLSKAEPLQLLFALLSIDLVSRSALACSTVRRTCGTILGAAAALAATLTKETGVVLFPLALIYLALTRLLAHPEPREVARRVATRFVLATGMAAVAFPVLVLSLSPASPLQGTYTRLYAFTAERLIGSLAILTVQILHSMPHVPFALFCVAYLTVLRRLKPCPTLLYSSAWMAIWAAMLLPWPHPLAYHLLAFTAGASAFSGFFIYSVFWDRTLASPKMLRIGRGIFALLIVSSWSNSLTAARMQLAIDNVNGRLVEFLASLPPSSVVGFDLPRPNEYVYETGLHLSLLKARPDLKVGYFPVAQAQSPGDGPDTYWVLPSMHVQLLPSVRCAVNEPDARMRNERAVRLGGPGWREIWHTSEKFRLGDIGLHRLFCPLLGQTGSFYCTVPRPLIETREFSYGWRISRVRDAPLHTP